MTAMSTLYEKNKQPAAVPGQLSSQQGKVYDREAFRAGGPQLPRQNTGKTPFGCHMVAHGNIVRDDGNAKQVACELPSLMHTYCLIDCREKRDATERLDGGMDGGVLLTA
eukprot:GGOE01005767.1.p2 GENE.GGOE01005767.1~~GGOE01005767.1.p2  ORF type:complete len:110 (+),score=0.11 GGOE01005767.1:181-510(+)